MYLGARFPFLPNLITPFIGYTSRNTKSLAEKWHIFPLRVCIVLLSTEWRGLSLMFQLHLLISKTLGQKISLLNLCTPGPHILVPFRNVPSLSITKSRDWPCCTSNWTFCSWALLWYALTISKYTNRTLNRDIMHFFSHFNYNPWSIDSCGSFIIDLLPVLMYAKLPANFLLKASITTFALPGW